MKPDYDKMATEFSSLSKEERDAISNASVESSLKEHAKFVHAFGAGTCYLCRQPLTAFSANQPCLHWLLKPSGFKKEHLPAVVDRYSMLQMETYLRWVASTEGVVRHINDLSDEGTGKLREVTIRYKHLEWSFSCSVSDLHGHPSTAHSDFPHFHFQMRVNGHPFIRFNDFHLPIAARDAAGLEMALRIPELFKIKFPGGEGADDLLQPKNFDALLSVPTNDVDPDSAGLEISTMVLAEDEHGIDGTALYELIEKARADGVSIASRLRELPNAKVTTVISPGPGVVEQAPRKGRGKRRGT